jgi:hypothetical protein
MGRSVEKVSMERISLIVGILLLASCGAIKESEDDKKSNGNLKQYEATFRPSEYDQPLSDFFPEPHGPASKDTGSTSTNPLPQSQELIQGYRVQIFATSNYDDVTKMKESVESQFPDEWFYVVYDAPTYKLRVGNFLERYEADRFVRVITEKGYKDAWVVPERVYKSPPLRAAPSQNPGK